MAQQNNVANKLRNVIDSDLSIDQKVNACLSHSQDELKHQCKEIREWARANSWTDYDTNTQILRFTDLNSLLDSLEEKA